MKLKATALTTTAVLGLALQSAAQAGVVGYNCTLVPPVTDAYVSVPFPAETETTLTVTAVNASGVSVAGPLTVNQYQAVYYVRITTGNACGRWSTIASNTATDLVFSDTTFVGDIAVGDEFKVYRHATLASVFPDGYAGLSYIASTAPAGSATATRILIPGQGNGINQPASATYFFFGGAWRKIGGGAGIFDNVVLPPQQYFIVRNLSTTATLSFYALGDVDTVKLIIQLERLAGSDNDNPAAQGAPLPRTLAQLNLGGTAAFKTATAPTGSGGDKLLVWDNPSVSAGINRASSATYFYFGGAWRKIGGGATIHNDTVLPGGSVALIRTVAGTAGLVNWTQDPLITED